MHRVMVAGGAGFLGSHLCERLLARGDAVTCVDNLLTGSIDNVAPLLGNRMFQLIEHDVRLPLRLKGKLDHIYNLACPASPRHYMADPHATVMTSVLGASNLLALADEKGARLLQASTSEIYGDPLEHPQAETDRGNVDCTGPRACYDEGKRCAETLVFDARRRGADVRVARIFNTYGPRMQEDDGRVVSNFIVQALRGEALTVYGNGQQTRSFCYVDDLIDGLTRMMHGGRLASPINLGNPEEIEVIDLARRVIAMTRSRSPIVFEPLPVDDPKRRRPHIALAREQLGWTPRTALVDGLTQTIGYFREKIGQSSVAAVGSRSGETNAPAYA